MLVYVLPDVIAQQFSVETTGSRVAINVNDQLRRPLLPLHAPQSLFRCLHHSRSSRRTSVQLLISQTFSSISVNNRLFLLLTHLSFLNAYHNTFVSDSYLVIIWHSRVILLRFRLLTSQCTLSERISTSESNLLQPMPSIY